MIKIIETLFISTPKNFFPYKIQVYERKMIRLCGYRHHDIIADETQTRKYF